MRRLGSFIPPRLTEAERDAITSPEDGELIFNTTVDCYEFYELDETTWRCMFSEGGDPIPPSEIGGGAFAEVVSFASGGSSFITSGSPTYESIAHMIYGGSDDVGLITKVNANVWVSGTGVGDLRLIDINTGLVIASIIGINSEDEANLQDMGVISNLPTTPTVIEIQARKTTGGGSIKIQIASLQSIYL